MAKLHRYGEENTCYHVVTTTRGRDPLFRDPSNAGIVVAALQHLRRRCYLLAFAVMPDHVHALIVPRDDYTSSQIMQGLKGYTSRVLNARAGRRGSVWQQSFYDRIIRNDKQLWDTIEYVHNNPVAGGLSVIPETYDFSSAGRDSTVDLAEFFGQ
ncbi:MAG: transposase [Dehalococcoidia bacterium]